MADFLWRGPRSGAGSFLSRVVHAPDAQRISFLLELLNRHVHVTVLAGASHADIVMDADALRAIVAIAAALRWGWRNRVESPRPPAVMDRPPWFAENPRSRERVDRGWINPGLRAGFILLPFFDNPVNCGDGAPRVRVSVRDARARRRGSTRACRDAHVR